MPVNPDATVIPDKAEVWVAHKADVTDIESMYPATPTEDLAPLGWSLVGIVDAAEGIPLEPDIEVKEYDGRDKATGAMFASVLLTAHAKTVEV